jgi:serine/threonine-protein phosphatase 2A regulatory subunit B''
MIVDRIFDAAPRPFEQENPNREYLTYESFIYFMYVLVDPSTH